MGHTGRAWLAGVLFAAAFAGGVVAQLVAHAPAALAGEAKAQNVLRLQKVVFVDAEGRERGSIGVEGSDVGLVLKDAEGRGRLRLGAPAFADPQGKRWVILFSDAKGQDRLLFAVQDDGSGGGMALSDAKGVLRGGIGCGPTGIGLTLNDEKAALRASIGVGDTGVGIAVRDAAGRERAAMGAANSGWGGVKIIDKDGKQTWSADQDGGH